MAATLRADEMLEMRSTAQFPQHQRQPVGTKPGASGFSWSAQLEQQVTGRDPVKPPSPSKSSRGSTPSPPREDLLASVAGLHQQGTFNAKQRLWTRSLALRRGGTVVVAEDYGKTDDKCDGQWCAPIHRRDRAHSCQLTNDAGWSGPSFQRPLF